MWHCNCTELPKAYMTFQSAMLLSGLDTVSKPVLSELSVGPNFRSPVEHSANAWVRVGGRTMCWRRVKNNYHDSRTAPSISILWCGHWQMMGDARRQEKVAFCEGHGTKGQKDRKCLWTVDVVASTAYASEFPPWVGGLSQTILF